MQLAIMMVDRKTNSFCKWHCYSHLIIICGLTIYPTFLVPFPALIFIRITIQLWHQMNTWHCHPYKIAKEGSKIEWNNPDTSYQHAESTLYIDQGNFQVHKRSCEFYFFSQAPFVCVCGWFTLFCLHSVYTQDSRYKK